MIQTYFALYLYQQILILNLSQLNDHEMPLLSSQKFHIQTGTISHDYENVERSLHHPGINSMALYQSMTNTLLKGYTTIFSRGLYLSFL